MWVQKWLMSIHSTNLWLLMWLFVFVYVLTQACGVVFVTKLTIFKRISLHCRCEDCRRLQHLQANPNVCPQMHPQQTSCQSASGHHGCLYLPFLLAHFSYSQVLKYTVALKFFFAGGYRFISKFPIIMIIMGLFMHEMQLRPFYRQWSEQMSR